jgi:hypothetical protein
MVNILCQRCGEYYKAKYSTVKIKGPVVHMRCPFCKYKSYRGFSKFAELQMGKDPLIGRFDLVADMMKFARALEGEIIER